MFYVNICIVLSSYYSYLSLWRLCITTGKQQLGATGRHSTVMQSCFCPAGGNRVWKSWTQQLVSWSRQLKQDSPRYKRWQTNTAHRHNNDAPKQSALHAAVLHLRSIDVWPPALVLRHQILISSFHVLDNRPPVRVRLNSLLQLERRKNWLKILLFLFSPHWKWGIKNLRRQLVTVY